MIITRELYKILEISIAYCYLGLYSRIQDINMIGKKVINERAHQSFESADRGEVTIIIPAIVLMEERLLHF